MVESERTSIRHACQTFALSETGYRYRAKASAENARIADWLVRLTTAYRDWGFGLCFLHLRSRTDAGHRVVFFAASSSAAKAMLFARRAGQVHVGVQTFAHRPSSTSGARSSSVAW